MTDNEMTSARLALRRALVKTVEEEQGIKATALVAKVVVEIGGQAVDGELAEELDALIEEGEIVEVEYVLPQMDYRIKSFLLPKGTSLRIASTADLQVIAPLAKA